MTDLSFNFGNSEDLHIICDKCPNLRKLALFQTRSYQHSIEPCLLTVTTLTELHIYNLSVNDVCLNLFSSLVCLQTLSLSCVPFQSSNFLSVLASSFENSSLKNLELEDLQVTDTALRTVLSKLKLCWLRIHFGNHNSKAFALLRSVIMTHFGVCRYPKSFYLHFGRRNPLICVNGQSFDINYHTAHDYFSKAKRISALFVGPCYSL